MEFRSTSFSSDFNELNPFYENQVEEQLQVNSVFGSISIYQGSNLSIKKSVKVLNCSQIMPCFSPQITKVYQLKDLPWFFRQSGNIIDFSPSATAIGLRNAVYLFISNKIKTYLLPNFTIWPEIKWIKWINPTHLAVCAYYDSHGSFNEFRTFILDTNKDTDPWIRLNSHEGFINQLDNDRQLIGHSTILKTTEETSYELINVNPFFIENSLFHFYKQPKNERFIVYQKGLNSKIGLYTNCFQPIVNISEFENRVMNPNSIAWDTEERFVAFPSDDRDNSTIVIWDYETKEQSFCIPVSGIVNALWWINNILLCTVTVSASDTGHGEIQAWEINPNDKTAILLHSTNAGEKIYSEKLSSNKKLLITIGNDGIVKWWDVSCLKSFKDIKLYDIVARSINLDANYIRFS